MSTKAKISNEELVKRIRSNINTTYNMQQLWQQNTGMINIIAKKYSCYAEYEDLQQEGYIGLYHAVTHYDESKEVPFMNYATFWIRQAMVKYLYACSSTIKIPDVRRKEIAEYKRIVREYIKHYGHEISDREIRGFLRISQEKLNEIRMNVNMGRIKSINEPIGEDDTSIEELLPSCGNLEEEVIRKYDHEIMKKELWVAMETLSVCEQEVLKKRYIEQMTAGEVGKILAIEEKRVRNMEKRAKNLLGHRSKSHKYRKYFEQYLSAAQITHIGVSRFQHTWTSEVEHEVLRKYQ